MPDATTAESSRVQRFNTGLTESEDDAAQRGIISTMHITGEVTEVVDEAELLLVTVVAACDCKQLVQVRDFLEMQEIALVAVSKTSSPARQMII